MTKTKNYQAVIVHAIPIIALVVGFYANFLRHSELKDFRERKIALAESIVQAEQNRASAQTHLEESRAYSSREIFRDLSETSSSSRAYYWSWYALVCIGILTIPIAAKLGKVRFAIFCVLLGINCLIILAPMPFTS